MATATNNEWWLVQDFNGAIGLVRGQPPNNAVASFFIGTANDFNDLLNGHAAALGRAQGQLAKAPGTTPNQIQALISQIDHGAGLHNPNWIYIGSNGQPSSNVSTGLGSEANPTNVIPSPIPPSVGNTGGGLLGSLSFLSFFGSLGFWKGIGLVLAGAAILVFAALEFRKMT